MVAAWLGFAVQPAWPGIHIILVCVVGGFAGGAILGWVVGVLKARTGAHEVIVTIMLNYVMYNLLSYLLKTPKALQEPHQSNQIAHPEGRQQRDNSRTWAGRRRRPTSAS